MPINDDFDESVMFTADALNVKPAEKPTNPNPLAKWFRTPGVHIKLPTNGAFMPPGTFETTMTGDVPVYPMRGADELLLKSPDALMSGFAIEELIKSCVPSIKMPRLISSPDLDVLLMAIRAATYGEVITFSPICPACGEANTTHRNLSFLLSNMKMIDKNNPVRVNDEMVIYLRPYNLTNATKLGLASFEEARKLQALETSEDVVAKTSQVNSSMQRIANMTMEALGDCIIKIAIPTQEVFDPNMIREFIADCGKPITDAIQAKLDELNSSGMEKKYSVTCSSCQNQWDAEVEFNPVTFFAASS